MRHFRTRVERLRGQHRQRILCEALESRILLTGYTFALVDQGTPALNGTYLKKLINGQTTISNADVSNHVVALGDTLILPNTLDYDFGAVALNLPNLGTAATVTLDGSGGVGSAVVSFTGGNYGNVTSAAVSFVGGGGFGASGTATIVPDGVTGMVISNNGNQYTAEPTVIFNNGGTGETTSAAASAVLTTYIDSVKISAGGVNYGANTTVSFSGGLGAGGVAATGHLVISGGVIKNVLIDSGGSGYTATPTLVFTDPDGTGSGAAGYGTFGIDHFNFTSYGAGYTAAPTVSFSGGGGSGAIVNAIVDGVVSITVNNAGAGYTVAPTIAISAGTLTIESSALASLPSGVRAGPAQAALMPKLEDSTSSLISTVLSDNYGHSGPAHDYAFIGLEIAPANDTQMYDSPMIAFGDNSIAQNDVSLVAHDFLVDRCYIHGLDNLNTNYKSGISLNCKNAIVENSSIMNIHNNGQDANAIGGINGLGNYTITNNELEATGENFMQGGGDIHIPGANPTHIVFTHNYVTKRLIWCPYDPSYAGVHMDVKNLFELKDAVDVTVDGNLFENNWVGADQAGYALVMAGKNQYGTAPWTVVSNVTVTNNVIRNVGGGMELGFDAKTSQPPYYTSMPMHDIVIRNNLFENINGTGQGSGGGFSISCGTGLTPGWNLTIDHNTLFTTSSIAGMDTGSGSTHQPALSSGFVFTNNVVLYAQSGLHSGPGEGTKGMNIYMSGLTVSNGGSGYTTAPLVSFDNTGTGGSGAVATAFIANGRVYALGTTNGGSGYTAAPKVKFDNTNTGGSGVTATAIVVGGVVKGWTFANNVIIGAIASQKTYYTADTMFRDTEDLTGFRDTPGDDFSLLATINGAPNTLKGAATNGTDPGVDENALINDMSGYPAGNGNDFIPLDKSLQGYWKFDDGGSGTTAADATGNGHTGTLSSSSLWTTSGEMNTALAFNGTSGFVSVPTFAAPTALTLAAWIKPGDNTGHSGTIMSKGAGEFILQINSSGYLAATIAGTTLTDTSFNYYAAANNSQWYLVGVTFDPAAGTMSLYRGGVQVATAANTGTIADSGLTLRIGQDTSGSATFLGTIDEARYYNQALSAAQMDWLYSGFGPLVDGITPGSAKQTGTTSKLAVWALGHADAIPILHQSGLSFKYTWSLFSQPAGVPTPTFDGNNGTNAGQDCVVTYYGPGTYNFQLVVTDGLGGTTTSLHALTVIQGVNNLAVLPASVTLPLGGTQQFTASAIDQFGSPFTPTVKWSIGPTDAGSIDPVTGLYTAPSSGTGSATVTATSGTTTATAAVTISSQLPAVPDIPSITSATASNNSLSINLIWTDTSSGVTGYNIRRSPDGGTTWSNVATGVTTTNYTDSAGVAGNTSYIYQVNAYFTVGNNSGWSASSNSALTIPAAPTGLSALAGAGQVILAWSANTANVQGFNILRCTDGVNFQFLLSVDVSQLAYADAATTPGVTYYYGITAYNATGVSPVSNTSSSKNAIPGDATLDGKVTGTDYTVWADNYGKPNRSWTTGDFTGDGLVTGADYTVWADNYGKTAAVMPAAPVVAPAAAAPAAAAAPQVAAEQTSQAAVVETSLIVASDSAVAVAHSATAAALTVSSVARISVVTALPLKIGVALAPAVSPKPAAVVNPRWLVVASRSDYCALVSGVKNATNMPAELQPENGDHFIRIS